MGFNNGTIYHGLFYGISTYIIYHYSHLNHELCDDVKKHDVSEVNDLSVGSKIIKRPRPSSVFMMFGPSQRVTCPYPTANM